MEMKGRTPHEKEEIHWIAFLMLGGKEFYLPVE